MKHRIITRGAELRDYLLSLEAAGVETIALDLEGEFNLHQYGEMLCLIQLFDGSDLVAVDPIAIDPPDLAALFESESLLKVMYDSLSDQALVQKCYGFGIKTILDLRPATELLPFDKKDLGSVLETTLGIRIEKKKKFQRYNWTRRPIDLEAIEYALSDVAHLLRLRDALTGQLRMAGLVEQFISANERVQDRDFLSDRTPRIFKSGQYLHLPPRAKTLFEKIYKIRDLHARNLNVPPDTVMDKRTMFGLATESLSPSRVALNRRIPNSVRTQLQKELVVLLAETGGK